MSDDLDKKLKQIADMFGVSDTGNLKNIVESIVPPNSTAANGSPGPEPNASNIGSTNYSSAPPGFNRNAPVDLGVMSKLGEMLSAFNNVSDSRITLLHSVQPFLGNQRQQRLGGAIQLLKILAVLNSISPNINRNTKG